MSRTVSLSLFFVTSQEWKRKQIGSKGHVLMNFLFLQKYRLGKSQQTLESCIDGSINDDGSGIKQEVEGFIGSEDYKWYSIFF